MAARRLYINSFDALPDDPDQHKWVLQWGRKTAHGWSFESPIATFPTKKKAQEARRECQENPFFVEELQAEYLRKKKKEERETHRRIEVVSGVEGSSLYLEEYRVAGPKPWGGGRVTQSWRLDHNGARDLVNRLLPFLGYEELPAED